MGYGKAQKWILSGTEGLREPPGLPSLNASAGACVSQFPCALLGLAAPVRLEHGVCTGVLWLEKAPLQLQILWLWHCVFGFFPKPESNFIPGSSIAPPVSHGNAVLGHFPRVLCK